MKDTIENKVEYEKTNTDDRKQGRDIFHAPQKALTAATGGSLTTGGGANLRTADAAILANAVTRLSDLETALIKLGFLRHP